MGKDCLEIFLILKLTEEQRGNIANSIEALEEYFKPKTSVVYERYRFDSCVQSPDESIDAFVNRIRKAASSCKSGTLTDELIRDEPLTKEKILKEYIDVFEGLGHIGDASTFVVDTNQSPVQHTPRRIAVALKKEVKAKVEELEKKVIIKKETELTEGISSMVVVVKPEKIRICLDPQDLNKALLRPK